MLLSLERIWAKVQEFIGRVDKLEVQSGKTQGSVEHLDRKMELLEKGQAHTDKVVGYLVRADTEKDARIKKLESEKHGAKSSAGRAKKEAFIANQELEKLKREFKGPKDPKKRH